MYQERALLLGQPKKIMTIVTVIGEVCNPESWQISNVMTAVIC
jgi:hypothetical protein